MQGVDGIGLSNYGGKRLVKMSIGHLPASQLYPNMGGKVLHWGVRAEARKMARQESYYQGYALDIKKPLELMAVEFVFHAKNKRSRDLDNLIAASKPWLDGLVDAGIMVDDDCWHIRKLSAGVVPDDDNFTELIIEEVSE